MLDIIKIETQLAGQKIKLAKEKQERAKELIAELLEDINQKEQELKQAK